MADAVIGALRVVLGADSAAFEKQMGALSKKLGSIGTGLKAVGAGLAAYLSVNSISNLASVSVKAFAEAEQSIAKVDAALKATGNRAGKTIDELKKSASELQNISTFDDDEILGKVTANLLRFDNVSGATFDRAQHAILEMSSALGKGLGPTSVMVGKALQDPIKGISLLQRAGISFTEDQKKLIKQLVETGDMAGAQKIILDQLFSVFGGQAEAAAKTVNGAFKQMQNSVSDALESIGAVIAPYVVMFAQIVKGLADAFANLSPSTQKFIVVVGGLAAVLGPLLLSIGLILPALAALAPAFALIGAPAAIVIAAIAAVSVALNALGIDFSTQWEVVKIAFKTVIDFIGNQIQFFKALFTGDFAGAFEAAKKIITDMLASLGEIIDTLFPGLVASMRNQAIIIGNTFVELKNKAVKAMADLYAGVKQWLADKLTATFDYVQDKINALAQAFASLYDKVVGHSYIPDMVTESTDWLKQMGKSMDTLGDTHVARWNANMASMTSANASINTTESASVSAANDNATGGAFGRGRGDIYLGGITIQATDYQSFKQSKGQLQNDLADAVRVAMAGR